MKFRVRKEWRSEHFKDFLQSKERYQILWGGRGSGKTHHIILKLIALSFLNEYNHIVYVNKVFGDIRKNQFKDIKKVLKALDLTKYFTVNNTNYGFRNNITGVEFTALGMDNYENTKGLSDPTIIWWDEITRGQQEDFEALNRLLRTPMNNSLQFIISFNPVSEQHWVRKYFFDADNPYSINQSFAGAYVNHSTYINNEFINQEDYRETLEIGATKESIEVNVYGMWGAEQIVNPFIYVNTEKLFNPNLGYMAGYPLWLSFDFNNDPMTCLVSQVSEGSHKHDDLAFIYTFDEIIVDDAMWRKYNMVDKIEVIAREIAHKYPNQSYYVTGDRSGHSGNASNRMGSQYLYICKLLNLNPQYQLKAPISNPTHIFSRTLVNSAIATHKNIQINPNSCPILAREIKTARMGEDNKLVKDRTLNKLDSFDAYRYQLHTTLPNYLDNVK